ncbi:MAG: hypothetical protein ACK2UN_00280 [Candidatus Promineifilaceae bacterium]
MSAGSQLLQFGDKIEVQREEIRAAESVRHLHLIVDRPATIFAAVSTADYNRLMGELNGSLSLQIGLPNLPPLLNIDAGQPRLPLAEAVKAIRRMDPRLQLRLNLSVAKGPLLAYWGLNGGVHYLLPYLYSGAFLRLLDNDLIDLDRQLFAAPDRATLVVLEDDEVLIRGSLLSVAGLHDAKRLLESAAPLAEHTRRRLKQYHDLAEDSLVWAGFQLRNITPAHFVSAACSTPGESAVQNAIRGRLAAHALAANVLYTADWSVAAGGTFEAGYAGAEKTAVINIPAAGETNLDMRSLARWAVWPFGAECDRRLSILQNVSARRLPGSDGGANYIYLQERYGQILKEARWHHRHFLNGRIESNYKALQDMSAYAASVSSQIGRAIDSLTRGFTTAALGAVAVLLLSLLPAMLDAARAQTIFRAGLISYALFLVLFQGVYRMGSLLQNFRLLLAEAETQMEFYRQRLGHGGPAQAQAMIAARSRQFRTWFVITGVLLFAAALILLFLAARLPARLGMAF